MSQLNEKICRATTPSEGQSKPVSQILTGHAVDSLKTIPDASVHMAVTSPPYYPALRKYDGYDCDWSDGWRGALGDEDSPQQFADHLVEVFNEVRRVLRDDGTFWVNIGDSYAKTKKYEKHGIKKRDLMGTPWLLAQTMRKAGWYLRSDTIWHKPDAIPRSCTDRCGEDHEYMFMFAKSEKNYFDRFAIRVEEGGKSHYQRTVWKIAASNYKGPHVATFPLKLASRCIKATSCEEGVCAVCGTPFQRVLHSERVPTRPAKKNKHDETGKANRDPRRHVSKISHQGWQRTCGCDSDVGTLRAKVLDPFNGAGTTGVAAAMLGRDYIGCELSEDYVEASRQRIRNIKDVEVQEI